MINYILAKNDDIDRVAHFIARVNNNEENHIGYCGTDSEEIKNSLIEDLTDMPFNESFIVGIEYGEIIGVIGFDADLEDNSAEIWGPFIEKSKWYIVMDLWNEVIKILPKKIETISLFMNSKNKNSLKLACELGFNKSSEQVILTFNQEDKYKLKDISETELSLNYYEDFRRLHDRVFPNTYYSGSEILDRLNEHRKVFIDLEENKLTGYIYAEVNPEFGEGSIEFIAVESLERGKGIGKRLLTMALRWLFTFHSVESINLCVNVQNEGAINLYKSIGFIEKYHLYHYDKRLFY